jgi:hypothetical protein
MRKRTFAERKFPMQADFYEKKSSFLRRKQEKMYLCNFKTKSNVYATKRIYRKLLESSNKAL